MEFEVVSSGINFLKQKKFTKIIKGEKANNNNCNSEEIIKLKKERDEVFF